jgi:hypothetical protein
MVTPVLRGYRGDLARLDDHPERLRGLARAAHDLARRFALIPSGPAWLGRFSRDVEAHSCGLLSPR